MQIWLIALFICSGASQAQTDQSVEKAAPQIGQVNFPISCSPKTQHRFEHALAMLHHMMYAQAEQGFRSLVVSEPDCAMAHWGVAMTLFHPLWPGEPTEAELQRGSEAIEKASSLKPPTDREQAYVTAAGAYYKDWKNTSHPERIASWEIAQGSVYQDDRGDIDAAAFYALALLATAPKADKSYVHQKRAGSLLEELYVQYPEHPGVIHYLIHAYDNPPLAALPARYTLERRQWNDAAQLEIPARDTFPWEDYPEVEAIIHYARGLGAARSGDTAGAREALAALEAIHGQLVRSGQQYWGNLVDAQYKTVAAWVDYSEGKTDSALVRMREAAVLENSVDKNPVTPGSVLPAWELLGEMLLLSGNPEEALEAYEKSLAVSPNRFNSLYGAGYAADRMGNTQVAGSYYETLLRVSARADGPRPEIDRAKSFLADRNMPGDR